MTSYSISYIIQSSNSGFSTDYLAGYATSCGQNFLIVKMIFQASFESFSDSMYYHKSIIFTFYLEWSQLFHKWI